MTAASNRQVIIAGAGAIGMACAVALARAGYGVVLADPAMRGANASGVAAGMLAPAFEAALDPASKGLFALLKAGRDAWPALLAEKKHAPSGLSRSGALWVPQTSGVTAEAMAETFEGLGAQARILCANEAEALSAGLDAGDRPCLFTPEDWRLDAQATLSGLHEAAVQAGVEVVAASVTGFEPGHALLSGGQSVRADHLVIASGLGRGLQALAPELACLSPIKGQILFFEGAGPTHGPAIRSPSGYVAPRPSGAVVGATMEFGQDDLVPDAAVEARLRGAGGALFAALAKSSAVHRAGVRAATPDGLPLAGPSRAPGIVLACGARRNGWLLAALVAETVVAYVASDSSGPWAAAMDPRRFEMA